MSKEAECRGCHAKIKWGRLEGKPHPYNPDGESHFTTCPKAKEFRRGAAKPVAMPTLQEVSNAVTYLKACGTPVHDLYPLAVDEVVRRAKESAEEEEAVAPAWV